MSKKTSKGFHLLSDSEMDQVSGGSWDQPLTACDLFGSMIKELGYEGTKNTFYRHHPDQFYG